MKHRSRLLIRVAAVMAIAASFGWSAPSVAVAASTCPPFTWICNQCPTNKQAACDRQCEIVGGQFCFGNPQSFCQITSGTNGCSPTSPSLLCECA